MRHVIKKEKTRVWAFQLGRGSQLEDVFVNAGKIVRLSDEVFEVFSQEATDAHGEVAYAGDYVKIDSAGSPYPNKRSFFEQNHRQLGLNEYEQIVKPLNAWCLGDPVDEVITFMVQHKGLVIEPENNEKCFTAPLWGTMLSAKADAVIVLYNVERNNTGCIVDVAFNFVACEEFVRTYSFLT